MNKGLIYSSVLSHPGYPEGHSDAINKEQEIQWLKGKVDDGADFIVTQLFYDTDLYLSWFKSCREAGAWLSHFVPPSFAPSPHLLNRRPSLFQASRCP